MVKASVIIPAYNAEKTVRECIQGVLNQTQKDFELIVVDDGSTDNTPKIVESFKKAKLLKQQNGGPAKARNAGAKMAKGDVLVFTDSDCVAEKNWLEGMLKPFSDKSVVGVQGAYKTKQQSAVARFVQYEIEERYDRMKRSSKLDWVGSYSAAYQKKMFLEAGGFDESFPVASGEDPALSYTMAEKGKLVFNPKAIVYHQHPETVKKYFWVKFHRAYWRTLLYKRFPQKMVLDSFTPQGLKAQIAMVYAIPIVGVAGWSFSNAALAYFFWPLLALFLISPWALVQRIQSRDPEIAWIAPWMVYSRSVAFALGLPWGLMKGVWKK